MRIGEGRVEGLRRGLEEDGEEDLLEHLLTACILLLLVETPACAEQLQPALAALRLDSDRGGVQRALEAMEDAGLVFSTWAPAGTTPGRHTFHIAPAGSHWLGGAVRRLRCSEGFLGAFVARCGERFV
jgi:DNA-binding PadR family transcriptional regulator